MPSPRPALFTAVALATSAALPLSAADPLFAGAASSPHWLAVTNPDGGSAAAQDAFASALAVEGDTLLVGAPLDDAPGATDAGAAFVFVRQAGQWQFQAKLVPADRAAAAQFGHAVALSGDTALVSAWKHNTAAGSGAGAAYAFVRSGGVWTQQARQLAADGATGDAFGDAVALLGDTAVVGASGDDSESVINHGSAYVFQRSTDTWALQAKLLAGDVSGLAAFGSAVALGADDVLVGAPAADNRGAVYAYTRSGGLAYAGKLVPAGGAAFDRFGAALALSGTRFLAGAPQRDVAGFGDAGSAFVFVRSGGGWQEEAELRAADAAINAHLGSAVALSSAGALLGAPNDDAGTCCDTGAVYAFQASGAHWRQVDKQVPAGSATYDTLGGAVALSGSAGVAGAAGANVPSTNAGVAHTHPELLPLFKDGFD